MMMRGIPTYLFALAAAALFVFLPWQVLTKAPLDYQLYISQKIFYYHVPAATMMFVGVFVCGIASILFLWKRDPRFDDVAAAGGDLAVMFGVVVMVTGPIWAKAAWGVPWVWEARLTLTLLLWMIFIAYALVRRYGGPGSERLGAGLALFGMVNVPLVYFAVNFWKTQHPTNSVVPNLKGHMMSVFGTSMLAYLFLFLVLLAARLAVGRGQRRLAAAHDLAVENGYLD
jgi:heme exporter protein C